EGYVMHRLRKVALLILVLIVLPARNADASLMGFLDYLDQLSGPGPFVGGGLSYDLLCGDSTGWKTYFWNPLKRAPMLTTWPRYENGLDISWLRGFINDDLNYANNPSNDLRRVNAITYGGHTTVWLSEKFGLTMRAAAVRFNGKLMLKPITRDI